MALERLSQFGGSIYNYYQNNREGGEGKTSLMKNNSKWLLWFPAKDCLLLILYRDYPSSPFTHPHSSKLLHSTLTNTTMTDKNNTIIIYHCCVAIISEQMVLIRFSLAVNDEQTVGRGVNATRTARHNTNRHNFYFRSLDGASCG